MGSYLIIFLVETFKYLGTNLDPEGQHKLAAFGECLPITGFQDTPFYTTQSPLPPVYLDLTLGWRWYRRGYFRIPALNLPHINSKPTLHLPQAPLKEPKAPFKGIFGDTLEFHVSPEAAFYQPKRNPEPLYRSPLRLA